MVRAATSGAIDFAQFDPMDSWWWKRLTWTLDEIEGVSERKALSAQHRHYCAAISHGNLEPESFDEVKALSRAALNNYLKSIYPWLADQLGESTVQTDRELAVEQYHELFGYPGEERYEEMLQGLTKVFAHGKLTPREKEIQLAKWKNEAA